MLNILKCAAKEYLDSDKFGVLLAKIIYHGPLWPKLECINSNDIFRYMLYQFSKVGISSYR